jgi:uncharacterized protein (DUF1697 family)
MSHVVFVRAMNVGGKNVFRPAQLATALAHLEMVNVGAAGTFLVRGKASPAKLRREILARLPFEPALAISPAAEVLALVRSQPFRGVAFSRDLRGWVAALETRPKRPCMLPIAIPAGKAWSVRFDRIDGQFAIGLWRRRPGGFVFPSHVVERALGVPATMRWWETYERIARLIEP